MRSKRVRLHNADKLLSLLPGLACFALVGLDMSRKTPHYAFMAAVVSVSILSVFRHKLRGGLFLTAAIACGVMVAITTLSDRHGYTYARPIYYVLLLNLASVSSRWSVTIGGMVFFALLDVGTVLRWGSAGMAGPQKVITDLILFSVFLPLGLVSTQRKLEEERHARIIQGIPAALVISRMNDGLILDVNEGFCEATGFAREDVVGQTSIELGVWRSHEDRMADILSSLDPIGSRYELEVQFPMKDGQVRVALVEARLMELEGDRCILNAWTDITERKRAEGALQEAREHAERTSRAKGEFLADMSHEMRTPLTAMVGLVELMRDGQAGPVSPELQEYLGNVLTSTQHVMRLLNGVLDLARVESGEVVFNPEEVTLFPLVREVVDLFQPDAARKEVQIEVEVCPGEKVVADPFRLKQVLLNYVSNAVKFTPAGGRITVRALSEGADAFRIEVEDTGVGIRPEDIERLFVEFQQLEEGRALRGQGAGLGLALTKRIVEAQGGQVGVISQLGKGSTFYAVLPSRQLGQPL